MKSPIKIIYSILSIICFMILSLCAYFELNIPDEITTYTGEKVTINNYTTLSQRDTSKNAAPANSMLHSEPRRAEARLFGLIPVKDVEILTVNRKYVALSGALFGIKLYTKGAAVIECCLIKTPYGVRNPGREAGLSPGDTLLEIDGIKISSCEQVERIVASSDHDIFHIKYIHNNNEYYSDIASEMQNGSRQLGMWIRDSAAGLGTMTFFDPESGGFAALGHGICDSDTGALLTLKQAQVTNVEVAGITKGSAGTPGSINGYFSDSYAFGVVLLNSECGIYGAADNNIIYSNNENTVPLAAPNEVKRGYAQILCSLDGGEPTLYDIKITKISISSDTPTKNLNITVTDPRLIEKTGGIIQGMSGCPILQNGKLVGAVTHVTLTNPAKGYGIFAQKMYDEIEKAQN